MPSVYEMSRTIRRRLRKKCSLPTEDEVFSWVNQLGRPIVEGPEVLPRLVADSWIGRERIPPNESFLIGFAIDSDAHYTVFPAAREVIYTSSSSDMWAFGNAKSLTRRFQERFGRPK